MGCNSRENTGNTWKPIWKKRKKKKKKHQSSFLSFSLSRCFVRQLFSSFPNTSFVSTSISVSVSVSEQQQSSSIHSPKDPLDLDVKLLLVSPLFWLAINPNPWLGVGDAHSVLD